MRFLTTFLLLLSGLALTAQEIDTALYSSLQFRNIGPYRGGRSAAVTGVAGKPNLYYFGGAGGGVWQTKDGGQTWTNISDGFFGGSIGAVTVSESDNNVIYVGGGEQTVRGNVSYGYGMWKTIDGGKSWQQIGLENSRHIARIRVHPRDPQLVYAAVMGDLYKDTEERGVYRSKDGGTTWERVLFAGAAAGAVDLSMDPSNPRVLFASTWRIRRTPYSLESGGEGSGLWKSTDGGDNWTEITSNKGLPKGIWGINGVAVSPVDANRVYAIIENEKAGGVYVSDDGGETWSARSDDRALRQRAWYYTRIYADPQDIDGVYVMNVEYHHSTDGGRTFEASNAPHGDHHDLWIAPEDNERMIIADDGGAQVTFDQGENWSTYHNQPTAQFYRVVTDNSFPYRIYGAQQDNSTVRIRHRTDGGTIGESDWEETAGGESAHIAPDPNNPDIVYGGSYGGFLTRYDHSTNQVRAINVWPDNPMGYGAEGMKYRFQWNFPIFFSPNDPKVLYTTSQHVHRSTDEGETWEVISPDLTRNEADKLQSSGGPITQDNTGVEYYATIFTATESNQEPGVLWTGSDDGLIHVTRDDGATWTDVTPVDAPKYIMWNSLDVDQRGTGGVYAAGTAYKLGDYSPYLYHSSDYGKTWRRIDGGGIDRGHFTRVVRQYPGNPEVLFAGTESGLYISMDDGNSWRKFQQNMPIVPVTDLAIKDDNLIVATQGRSFWIMDDLTPLQQLGTVAKNADFHLFKPADAWRMAGSSRTSRTEGQNHPGGVNFHLYLSEQTAKDTIPMQLAILQDGDTIRSWTSTAEEKEDKLELRAGGQTVNWDLQYPDGVKVPGMILWWAGSSGPMALPGEYTVAFKVGEREQTQPFTIKADPRVQASEEDRIAQFEFMKEVQDKTSEAHQVIIDLRKVRDQIKDFQERVDDEELTGYGKQLIDSLTAIEETLYQTKNRSGQDPLNYPIRLTNKLAHLNSLTGIGTYRPTAAAYAVKDEITAAVDAELARYRRIVAEQVPEYNRMILDREVEVISAPTAKKVSRK